MTNEQIRQLQIEDWRRSYRRWRVFKVVKGIGLTILICGVVLALLYTFQM